MTDYANILVEQREAVTLVTLNRPQALNALNTDVLADLTAAFRAYDADPTQRCLVLTGSGEKAFAAGADIKQMADKPGADFYLEDFFAGWQTGVVATRKPWIAAVNGFALGGGCELAMMADFIIASDTAKFGQPEIKLGVAPGMGGSQRLTRAVGKAKAMEMCLTGRMMGAEEAECAGLDRADRARRGVAGGGAEDRHRDRHNAADGGDGEQGDGQPHLREHADAGAYLRTSPVPDPDRDRGQGRGNGGVRREAPGGVEGSLIARRHGTSNHPRKNTWPA